MNFSEVGEVLYITGAGAKKRINKYKDNEKIKPFIIYKGKKIVGFKEEGVEELRNAGTRRRSYSQERKTKDLEHKNELLELELRNLKEQLNQQKEFTEDYKSQLIQARAEIQAFNNMSWIKRLTYKAK